MGSESPPSNPMGPRLFRPRAVPAPARLARRPLAVLLAALACAAALPARAPADAPRYQAKITDANRVGLTVTNYGFFGNNFNSRSPSLEYPLGSGFEHLSRAGLWIGALAVTD